jgi:hypothetical protein
MSNKQKLNVFAVCTRGMEWTACHMNERRHMFAGRITAKLLFDN